MDEMHPAPFTPGRPTSEAAWNSVLDSGWATEAMKRVYQILYDHGPLTLRELDAKGSEQTQIKPRGRSESTFVRRLYDLKANGLVDVAGERLCSVTDKEATTYDVTSNLCPEKRVVRRKLDLDEVLEKAENPELWFVGPREAAEQLGVSYSDIGHFGLVLIRLSSPEEKS